MQIKCILYIYHLHPLKKNKPVRFSLQVSNLSRTRAEKTLTVAPHNKKFFMSVLQRATPTCADIENKACVLWGSRPASRPDRTHCLSAFGPWKPIKMDTACWRRAANKRILCITAFNWSAAPSSFCFCHPGPADKKGGGRNAGQNGRDYIREQIYCISITKRMRQN